jgi:hypothetical protein
MRNTGELQIIETAAEEISDEKSLRDIILSDKLSKQIKEIALKELIRRERNDARLGILARL